MDGMMHHGAVEVVEVVVVVVAVAVAVLLIMMATLTSTKTITIITNGSTIFTIVRTHTTIPNTVSVFFIMLPLRYFAIATNFATQQAAVTYINTLNASSAVTVITPSLFHALACAPGDHAAGEGVFICRHHVLLL